MEIQEIHKKKTDFRENDIVFSQSIKAGKRIYYLDVKKNRKDELFLTITESKKLESEDINAPLQFEKHKIFLYKEDFDKFVNGLMEALNYIRENNSVDFVPPKVKVAEEEGFIDKEIIVNIDFEINCSCDNYFDGWNGFCKSDSRKQTRGYFEGSKKIC